MADEDPSLEHLPGVICEGEKQIDYLAKTIDGLADSISSYDGPIAGVHKHEPAVQAECKKMLKAIERMRVAVLRIGNVVGSKVG